MEEAVLEDHLDDDADRVLRDHLAVDAGGDAPRRP